MSEWADSSTPAAADGSEFVLHEFAPTPPMSTYLLAFVVGRIDRLVVLLGEDLLVLLESAGEGRA